MSTETQRPALFLRACDATYRGYLAGKPKRMEREHGGEVVRARMGVNMAGPGVPEEEHRSLTEWVDVRAHTKRAMDRLEACEKGHQVAVIGTVTRRSYQGEQGKAFARTIAADDVRHIGDSVDLPEVSAGIEPLPPGAIPKACDATYRGYLAEDPRTTTRESGEAMVTARMGVSMAEPGASSEDRDELTDWLRILVFSDACRARLIRCRKGDLVVITGNVTKRTYHTDSGELRVERTIVGEHVRAAAASLMLPNVDTAHHEGDNRPAPAGDRPPAPVEVPPADDTTSAEAAAAAAVGDDGAQ